MNDMGREENVHQDCNGKLCLIGELCLIKSGIYALYLDNHLNCRIHSLVDYGFVKLLK